MRINILKLEPDLEREFGTKLNRVSINYNKGDSRTGLYQMLPETLNLMIIPHQNRLDFKSTEVDVIGKDGRVHTFSDYVTLCQHIETLRNNVK